MHISTQVAKCKELHVYKSVQKCTYKIIQNVKTVYKLLPKEFSIFSIPLAKKYCTTLFVTNMRYAFQTSQPPVPSNCVALRALQAVEPNCLSTFKYTSEMSESVNFWVPPRLTTPLAALDPQMSNLGRTNMAGSSFFPGWVVRGVKIVKWPRYFSEKSNCQYGQGYFTKPKWPNYPKYCHLHGYPSNT